MRQLRSRSIYFSPRSYPTLLKWIRHKGSPITINGQLTHEVLNGEVIVKNPIDRLAMSPGRRMNVGFAVAEWLAMMTGRDRVDFFTPHIKDYAVYSDDSIHIAGAYGPRIQPGGAWSIKKPNQIRALVDLLHNDLNSRRAVLSVYDGKIDLFDEKKTNTPCTMTLQFLYRDQFLHMIVSMRSADIVRGLTYDLFAFSMIQEFVARQLEVELGWYLHRAGSLHLYDLDIPFESAMATKRWARTMDTMPTLEWEDIELAATLMDGIDTPHNDNFHLASIKLPQYLKNLVSISRSFVMRHKNPVESSLCYYECKDLTLRHLIRWRLSEIGVLKPWSVNSEEQSND